MPDQATPSLTELPAAPPPPAPQTPPAGEGEGGRLAAVLRWLSFRNISAIYIFAVIFVVFSIWVPDTFLAESTWRAMIDSQAITALVAIGLVLAVSSGAFNLAIGAEVGFGAILVAWCLTKLGAPIPVALALTVLAGALIGLLSGLLITFARIDSFIATLGVSSVLLAAISWVSGDQQILNLSHTFQQLGTGEFLIFTWPVWIMIAVGIVVWYVLERTSAGRHIYATGGNIDAARLAGVKTRRVIILSLAGCGMITALAGVLLTSTIATGDPTVGPAYLLPAFTAVFLGSTQFREGRFNVLGTVLVVYVLAAGVKGFQLAGAPTWIPDLFNGVALLTAVALAKFQARTSETHWLLRLLGRGKREEG
ncbi:MAG TPA: ABC transporter permease, partial [Solirubrobacterales bacterium]|nr:ABC transporter permease [Solirubrobacterales bacterium]